MKHDAEHDLNGWGEMPLPSGIVPQDAGDDSEQFSELTEIPTAGMNLLVKAKRGGQWLMLKGLKEAYRDDAACRKLLRKEYDILSQFDSPYVVKAVGMEAVSGLGECIVMEWIDGETLSCWLSGGHSRKERQRVATELTETVEHIHRWQVVHRDLKPQNIMITRDGQHVKLIDFGLADTDAYAIFKQPAGTEGYISEEQRTSNMTDSRNDIYSLGVILSEMNLGRTWRHAISKALLPIDKRWTHAEQIRAAVKRSHRLQTASWLVPVVLVVIAALFYIGKRVFVEEIKTDVVADFNVGNLRYRAWDKPAVSVTYVHDKQGRAHYHEQVIRLRKEFRYNGERWELGELGFNAFRGDTLLTTIYLQFYGEGNLMRGCFKGCKRLRDIYFANNRPPQFGNKVWGCKLLDAFDRPHLKQVTLHVPQGSIDRYRKSTWGNFSKIVEWQVDYD